MYRTTATSKNRHARNTHYDLSSDLESIKNAFANTAFDVRGKTGQLFSQSIEGMKGQSTKLRKGVETYAAEKPFKSLGIALLVGLAIGYLVRK